MAAEGLRHYRVALIDEQGRPISTTGGNALVITKDDTTRVALKTSAGASQSQPVSFTRGVLDFYTDDDTTEVDLYIEAPGGEFVVYKAARASGPNEIIVDTNRKHQVMVIPYSITDFAAATPVDTGFNTGTNKAFLPGGIASRTTTLDAGITIDVGTSGAGSNDADGFIDGLSVATAITRKATNANGAVTLGALMYVQDSGNVGDDFPEAFVDAADENITITLSAGADTAEGFVYLPYIICN